MDDINSYFPDFKVISNKIDSMNIDEISGEIKSLESKIEELEYKIKFLEEDEISRIDDELDRIISLLEDKYVSLDTYCNDWSCSIPKKWRQESEEDENTHQMDYDYIIKQEGDEAEDDQWSMLWGLTKMDKQIELLEENYNSIQKEQLCSCKTQELLEEKINKLETQLIYNQNIMVSMMDHIYKKMFPCLFNTINSMNENLEDYGLDTTNLTSEFNDINKRIYDIGIEKYVEYKCNGYIDKRDKDKIKNKIDKCKTLKDLTTMALKEGFKQEEIDNAIEKGNTGLTILKEKRNAHNNLYELIYKKYLEKSIDIRMLGLPISVVGPIFDRNLK